MDDSLDTLCIRQISKNPTQALTEDIVQRALRSERAATLIRRSSEVRCDGVGLDTNAMRQRILLQIIDGGGRSLPGSIPIPPNFLDDSFAALSLAGSKIDTSYVADVVCKACPSLRRVDLSGASFISDETVRVLVSGCRQIEELRLEACRKLTDDAVRHMVRHGTRLRAVDLGGCFNMSLKGVMDLITRHPNRENFDALQLPGLPLTHEFTAALPANCPNITSLGIGYNQLELLLLEQLLNPLARQLRALRVHWCVTVRDNMLLWIGQSCPRLRFLDVCGCKFVTINGVGTMLQAKQQCHEVRPEEFDLFSRIVLTYTAVPKPLVDTLQATYPTTVFVR